MVGEDACVCEGDLVEKRWKEDMNLQIIITANTKSRNSAEEEQYNYPLWG